jgi:hypothetical protein
MSTYPLSVLVKFVPNVEKLWMTRQIPEIDFDFLTADDHFLDAIVHPNSRNVLGHKLHTESETRDLFLFLFFPLPLPSPHSIA